VYRQPLNTMSTLRKIDNKCYKDAVIYANEIVRDFGLKKATRKLSDTIKDLSSSGDAIYNCHQILFFSLCLKNIRDNNSI